MASEPAYRSDLNSARVSSIVFLVEALYPYSVSRDDLDSADPSSMQDI